MLVRNLSRTDRHRTSSEFSRSMGRNDDRYISRRLISCWSSLVEIQLKPMVVASTVGVEGVRTIGVGDRGQGPPQKKSGKIFFSGNYYIKFGYFSGKYYVKFWRFVNFSYVYFRAKMSCPQKVTDLLRLWSRHPNNSSWGVRHPKKLTGENTRTQWENAINVN